MPVLLSCDQSVTRPLLLKSLQNKTEFLLQVLGKQNHELSILFTTDDKIKELNKLYRKKSKPTNVLAFAMSDGEALPDDSILGDIVISVDTAAGEAAKEGISLHKRILFLIIHGLLHLLGYDHERSEKDAALMEDEEKRLFTILEDKGRRKKMIQLAINVDHVATLRQARGIDEPDPVLAAGICELAGAAGVVVHLREDRRHIQDRDVQLLRQTVKTKLNLEMAASQEIIKIALDLKPDMITLVPEKREELTTEGGLDVAGQKKKIKAVIVRMAKAGIPVSLFVDPESSQIKTASEIGATFVELHTGRYCDAETADEQNREFELIATAAVEAHELGLRVNAGHGLNYQNSARIARLEAIEELSIGHSVMARAIIVGLDRAVREMLALLPG